MTEPTYIFLAGFGNSGDGHWQRAWHDRLPNSVWLEHKDWTHPDRDDWVADLQACLWKISGNMVIVGHSLGCHLVAQWSLHHEDPALIAAFLVAAPDPDRPAFPPQAHGFEETTAAKLPFATMVVASEDDEYAGIDYARAMAEKWGAEFVDVGRRGHINAASGVGAWDEGWELLQGFVGRLEKG